MPKKNVKILIVFLLIFLASCIKISSEKFSKIYISNENNLIEVNVEIADDNEEITKGLMFRERLEETAGMLFIFDDEQYRAFWMKNTLIPLDMIFIDKNFEIVDIKSAVPCKGEPCELYKSSKPVKYVLEVNGGFAAKNKLNIGDKIII